MTHNEAVGQMAAERYLLDELGQDDREAFEEHVFECQECAFDLRAGAAFVKEAKVQLPQIASAARPTQGQLKPQPKKLSWFSWFSPAFALPAFAVLLLVIGYQNLATIPSLRSAAAQPQVLPWSPVHMGTRGAGAVPVVADPKQGVVLFVDIPQEGSYVSYTFELYDPQGKRVWRSAAISPGKSGNGTLSLLIPGTALREGGYTLAISGILPSGETTEIGRRAFAVSFGG